MRLLISTLFIALIGFGFGFSKMKSQNIVKNDHIAAVDPAPAQPIAEVQPESKTSVAVNSSEVNPTEYVAFAKTLIGTPYLYGSVDPARGFDCSGFINYVSKHFDIKVPRSSVEFTNYGETVDVTNAKAGDLILFTGTDASRRIVGHMGIVTENNDGAIQFIHSSSGKGKGVILSEMEGYYETRFVKVVRILSQHS
jgi:cell wall-associated NlpC family hydrolase